MALRGMMGAAVKALSEPYLYNEGAGEDDWVAGFAWDWNIWYQSQGWGEYTDGADASQSKEADHLLIEHVWERYDADDVVRTWLCGPIDLTDFSTLKLDWETVIPPELEGVVSCLTLAFVADTDEVWQGDPNTGEAMCMVPPDMGHADGFSESEGAIDVSALTGNHYIHLSLHTKSAGAFQDGAISTRVNKVWLEP